MPILSDLLSRFVWLAALPAGIGVMVTATLLVVSRDWRLNVFALAVQYLFVTLLMTQIVRVEMAAVKGLIGWVTCVVFYLTEQQAHTVAKSAAEAKVTVGNWFAARMAGWRREGISAQAAFSFMAVTVVAVSVYAAAAALPLPELSEGLTLICYLLVGLGVLLLGLSRDPLRTGVGMLMILSGFDLFYVALEPSLVVTGLLGSISFVIALGTAFLKAAETVSGEQERVE